MLKYYKKLDERSKRYIHVKYAPLSYRLWDEEKRRIKIARDVKFRNETVKQTKIVNKKRKIIELQTEVEKEKEDFNELTREEDSEEEVFEDVQESFAEEQNNEEKQIEETRKSTRLKKKPEFLKDFVSHI